MSELRLHLPVHTSFLVFASLAGPCSTASAQGGGSAAATDASADAGIAAEFEVRGQRAQISKVDLALELARRDRLRPLGQGALDHLVHSTLVADAAKAAGVTPDRAAIQEIIRKTEEGLKVRGKTLDQFLAEKRMTRQAFEQDYVGLSIAHESLVMLEAGLSSRAEVTPELLQLWLDEARARVGVETDPSKLPPGIVAKIGERRLSMADLGEVLRQNATSKRRLAAVKQIVVRRLLDTEAKAAGIEVSQAEMDAEVETRRKRIESDPTLQGAKFENLLEAQGTTLAALRKSPVIRAQVQRTKLVEELHPAAEVLGYVNENRESVLLDHGPRRRVHVIHVAAAETPNRFVTLNFESAKAQAELVRDRIVKDGTSFGVVARIESEDAASKAKGGDLGMLPFRSEAAPRAVMEHAFALDPFLISKPIRAEDGYYLTMVTEVEDTPDDATLVRRVQQARANEFVLDLVQRADVRIID